MEQAVIGIIGCGNIAKGVHLGNAFSNPRIHVKWCCDVMEENLDYVIPLDPELEERSMEIIRKTVINTPVKCYDVIIPDICGCGVDIVATKSVEA